MEIFKKNKVSVLYRVNVGVLGVYLEKRSFKKLKKKNEFLLDRIMNVWLFMLAFFYLINYFSTYDKNLLRKI